jgi:DNA-binding transcriptional LysR family regulator
MGMKREPSPGGMVTHRASGASGRAKPSVRPPRMFVYFDAVVRHGSIRKAAEQLYVSSSALNRRILQLEQELGTPLFERLPRGVKLSDAGEIFYRYVREGLSGLEAACLQIDDLRGLVHGRVRLAATETVGVDLLPRAIADFNSRHPGVRFELIVAPSQAAAGAVLADEVDLVLALNPPSNPELETIWALPQPTCALVSPSHPLARRKRISLSDCMAYPLILPCVGMGGRTLLDQVLIRSRARVDPVLVSNSLEAMKGLARNSHAVCFQLLMGTRRDTAHGELIAIALSDPELEMGTLVLAARGGRILPVAAAAFVGTLKQFLSKLSR